MIAGQSSLQALESMARGWCYDPETNVVRIKFPDRGVATTVRVTE
ncbi:MAG: hypothetical protein ACRD06_01265 [Terriglobia bacterium]